MTRTAPIALALLLAACGGGAGNSSAPAAPPVAAVPAPAGPDWTQTGAKTDEGDVMGNPNAAIKLVEYGSRLCPTCKAFADQGYATLKDDYVKSGKVSFEFRDFMVHGADDVPAALLGQCVGAEAFFPVMEEMFRNQTQFLDNARGSDPALLQRIQTAPPAERFQLLAQAMGLIEFVKARGLPEDRARQCLANMDEVNKLTKITQDRGPAPGGDGTVGGTPTFLINGKVAEGALSWTHVQEALKKAGA